MACGILVSRPEMEPIPPAEEVQGPKLPDGQGIPY